MPDTNSTFFSRSKHALKNNSINNRWIKENYKLKKRDTNASINKEAIKQKATQNRIDELVQSQARNIWGFKPTYTVLDINFKSDKEASLSNYESKQKIHNALLIMSTYASLILLVSGVVNHYNQDTNLSLEICQSNQEICGTLLIASICINLNLLLTATINPLEQKSENEQLDASTTLGP